MPCPGKICRSKDGEQIGCCVKVGLECCDDGLYCVKDKAKTCPDGSPNKLKAMLPNNGLMKTSAVSELKNDCEPGTQCPSGCCDEEGWFCCADGLYCARTENDCPNFKGPGRSLLSTNDCEPG